MFSSNTSQVSNDVKYIEDFCSVYLRTGTGSSQTVTTGIKENTGALVISKSRSAATDWAWYDTFRGATKELASNTTAAEITQSQGLTAFNTDGHTWGTLTKVNTSGATYVDFVLKPTPKFFDVVTFTIDGASSNQQVAHNLGSTPGCIFVKASNAAGDWFVYHNATGNNNVLFLNGTQAASAETGAWSTSSTNFGIKSSALFGGGLTGKTAVAYLFAHNAGGFGLTGTDNVISCGSFTESSSVATVNLGYEPQWVLIKSTDTADNWFVVDNMRGVYSSVNNPCPALFPNTSGAESSGYWIGINATGFDASGLSASGSYIYIAIRRGPMKTPTSGTSVFSPNIATTNIQSGTQLPSAGFPVDLQIGDWRNGAYGAYATDRLRGGAYSYTFSTGAEGSSLFAFDSMTNVRGTGNFESSSNPFVFWQFRRAPGFFDEVCYTGTGSARTVAHNLGVAPELMIFKKRSGVSAWPVYAASLTAANTLYLDKTQAYEGAVSFWNNTEPTSSVFTVNISAQTNESGSTYVAYLFASCPGVQSIQSYVGDGTTGRTINCGFTGGARFVCIKATSTTGSWWTFDSARGIVTNNDPALQLNSTAAEVTSADAVDTAASGFIVNQEATCSLNASGVTYLVWAIA